MANTDANGSTQIIKRIPEVLSSCHLADSLVHFPHLEVVPHLQTLNDPTDHDFNIATKSQTGLQVYTVGWAGVHVYRFAKTDE